MFFLTGALYWGQIRLFRLKEDSLLWIAMALMASLLDRYGGFDEERDLKSRIARALVHFKLSKSDGVPQQLPEPASRIFVGSAGAAYHLENLRDAGITHIASLCSSVKHAFPEEFIYMPRVELNDDSSEESLVQFTTVHQTSVSFILDALESDPGHRVLVHCMQGKSRSVSICVAFLRYQLGMSYDDALSAVRVARPEASPNSVFEKFLQRCVT